MQPFLSWVSPDDIWQWKQPAGSSGIEFRKIALTFNIPDVPIGSLVKPLRTRAEMLRYAPRFHRNILKKNRQKIFNTKKFTKKNFRKISVKFFFQIFVGYPGSTANLGYACEKLGGGGGVKAGGFGGWYGLHRQYIKAHGLFI
jgi:hypothetical protein